jgi:hypothetical protein
MLVIQLAFFYMGLFVGYDKRLRCKNLRTPAGLGGSLEVATPFGDFRFTSKALYVEAVILSIGAAEQA